METQSLDFIFRTKSEFRVEGLFEGIWGSSPCYCHSFFGSPGVRIHSQNFILNLDLCSKSTSHDLQSGLRLSVRKRLKTQKT